MSLRAEISLFAGHARHRLRAGAGLTGRIAPTEKRRGQMNYLGDSGEDAGSEGEQWLRGQVHDPTSFRMGGIAARRSVFDG